MHVRLTPLGGDNVEGVDVVKELMRIEKKLEHIESLLNELLEGEEGYAMMKLSEESLKEFLKDEPDIYSGTCSLLGFER